MELFQPLFASVNVVLTQYLNVAVTNAAAYINGPITALATLSFIIFGLLILWGKTEFPLREFVQRSGLIALVLTVGGSAANYNAILADHLLAFPDDLMGVFAGVQSGGGALDDSASVGVVLDNIAKRSIDGITAIWQTGGWSDPGPALIAVALFGVFLLFGAHAAYAVLVMKIGLSLAVALGPLLILGLIFPATRDFFTRWLSYVLQFSVLAALIGGVAGIADAVVATYLGGLDAGGEGIDLMQLLAPSLVLVVLAILFAQLPGMASSITGGIGLGISNMSARGMWETTKFAGRGAGAAGRGLAGRMGRQGGSVSEGGSGGGTGSERRPAPPPRAANHVERGESDRPRPQPPKAPRVSKTRDDETRRVRERDRPKDGNDKK